MVTSSMTDLKVDEAALRRKLESTRDLAERRQIRALLKTLKEKREQKEQDVNNNVTTVSSVKTVKTTSITTQRITKSPGPKVRFGGDVEDESPPAESSTNMLDLRRRRRSLAKPPPSTTFLMNKLSNVMQREKAAQSAGRSTGPNAIRNKFEKIDANNNTAPGKGPINQVKVTNVQTKKTVVDTLKKEEGEISHPNRSALRDRRRSVAKIHQPKPAALERPGAVEEPPKAKDARFQRRLSRTRMTRVDSKDGRVNALGKPAGGVPGVGMSPADRMAFFKQAAEQDKPAVKPAPKPAAAATPPPKPAPAAGQNKENKTDNVAEKPIEKIPRRSPPKKKPQLKRQMSVSQLVLQWCKEQTEEYENVNITNFSASWADGLGMAALIHKFNPGLFDFTSLIPGDRERNFTIAFQAAEKVDVPVLLDIEDLVRMKKPEPRSIQTQVQMIFSKYRPKDLDTSQLTIC